MASTRTADAGRTTLKLAGETTRHTNATRRPQWEGSPTDGKPQNGARFLRMRNAQTRTRHPDGDPDRGGASTNEALQVAAGSTHVLFQRLPMTNDTRGEETSVGIPTTATTDLDCLSNKGKHPDSNGARAWRALREKRDARAQQRTTFTRQTFAETNLRGRKPGDKVTRHTPAANGLRRRADATLLHRCNGYWRPVEAVVLTRGHSLLLPRVPGGHKRPAAEAARVIFETTSQKWPLTRLTTHPP